MLTLTGFQYADDSRDDRQKTLALPSQPLELYAGSFHDWVTIILLEFEPGLLRLRVKDLANLAVREALEESFFGERLPLARA